MMEVKEEENVNLFLFLCVFKILLCNYFSF